MTMCMVNEQGILVDIPQVDREPNEGEFKAPLQGYYERLNEDRYDNAIWSFELEKWIGQGKQRPMPEPQIKVDLEYYILDLEFRLTMIELGGM